MNLSLDWLSDYIDIDVTPHDFSSAMTMSGSKVEGYEHTGAGIQNVVVGKILSTEKHPDADKLIVCSVDTGASEPVQIVTGADNVYAGALVPVCLDGAVLPDGTKIKTGKLRGVLSQGMLCSIAELGVTLSEFPYAAQNGILIIQEPCTPGQDIKEALKLNDVSVEFEITSNRPDCLSVIGLAVEAGATFKKPLKLKKPAVSGGGGKAQDLISVSVEAPELCPRYAARVVKDIKIAPSPLWMRMRLRAAGVRPINNIVDITNYVMLEYGQPMHAFDRSFLEGGKIIVRRANDGETITTLDDKDHVLSSKNLVICDAVKPVAVAGVMGGKNSEIIDSTKDIVFESANFAGANVRKTAKQLGLRTESSARFEKGLDPNMVIDAVNRACELVELLGCGTVCDGIIDVSNINKTPEKIEFDAQWINRFLGTEISKEHMTEILKSLKFEVSDSFVTAPSFRIDIENKADIAEEVARIYGYNEIPTTIFKGETTIGGLSHKQRFEKQVAENLISCGMYELYTFTFISPLAYDKINMPSESAERNSVKIQNPFGEETSIMRTTALPSLMDALALNYAQRNKQASLFEIAKIFTPADSIDKLPQEQKIITAGCYGPYDFYDIKGIFERLFRSCGIAAEFVADKNHYAFHPGKTAAVIANGEKLGYIGELHPSVCVNYGIKQAVYAAMLDFEKLYAASCTDRVYTPLPRFPSVSRDLAMVCDDAVTVSQIEKIFKKHGKALLEEINLFDVYKGAQIPKGKKSIAYSLVLRASDRTLTDAETDKIISKIVNDLQGELGAVLRA